LQGSLPIIDLLDLQSNVTVSEINSTGTRYTYFQSFVRLLRSIGKIEFVSQGFKGPEAIAFLKRMDDYVKEKTR